VDAAAGTRGEDQRVLRWGFGARHDHEGVVALLISCSGWPGIVQWRQGVVAGVAHGGIAWCVKGVERA
jgi:hypothetical protein